MEPEKKDLNHCRFGIYYSFTVFRSAPVHGFTESIEAIFRI